MRPSKLASGRPKGWDRPQHRMRKHRGLQLEPRQIAEICHGRVLRQGHCMGTAARVTIDSRTLQEGDCFVALSGDRFDGHEFVREAMEKGAAGAVVSRAVPRTGLPSGPFLVKVTDTHAALLTMAAEYRRSHAARVVGITGSCGKTSTKDMLGYVLGTAMRTVQSPRSFNNHVGVPLTLFQLEKKVRAAVVEIGSNAPGEIASLADVVQPEVAIVTSVAESHLQGLGSLAGVAAEKASLLHVLPEHGLAILNGDDPRCEQMEAQTEARVVKVRVEREADLFATDVRFCGLGTTFRLMGHIPVTIPRMGSHNVHNALFTIAAAEALGMDRKDVLRALCDLPNSRRRLECKRLGDITVVDDTYNSNPGSARAALQALAGMQVAGRRVVVLGEMLELGERSAELHRQLGGEVKATGVDLLVTVGAGAEDIAKGARAAGMRKKSIVQVPGVTAAVDELAKLLEPGDWLLCKGSRRIGLDRVVDDLTQRFGSAAHGHASPA